MAKFRRAHLNLLTKNSKICLAFDSSPSCQTRSYSSPLQSAVLGSSSAVNDGRSRLSKTWAPSGGIAVGDNEDAFAKLVRAGFLRQAHSGIFHILPLGRRVQEKIERLVDKYMSILGASKLELSSISSEELWKQSGRLSSVNSELFRFKDRKEGGYLLSPTHEEEITCLVANTVKSYKDLPVRLYQISRKYRDELRPRQGLLRSREFVMKDLYTFDSDMKLALETYRQVQSAYSALFDELKIPYLVAEADSGDMGGSLSHEYHIPTSAGEDHVISCDHCSYVANEELAESKLSPVEEDRHGMDWLFVDSPSSVISGSSSFTVWRAVSRQRTTLINVWYALNSSSAINTHAVKAFVPDLDAGVENASSLWAGIAMAASKSVCDGPPSEGQIRIVNLIDSRLPASVANRIISREPDLPLAPGFQNLSEIDVEVSTVLEDSAKGQPLNLMSISNGDPCSRCEDGHLTVQRAIELGHTFFLGTRYSDPLGAKVSLPTRYSGEDHLSPIDFENQIRHKFHPSEVAPIQMGCHGIGVSRLIGAVADAMMDDKGLNWPRVISPFEVVIVPINGLEADANSVYDRLILPDPASELHHGEIDAVLDDRMKSFAWKMRDADLVGYPVIVVLGRDWKSGKCCEVQCRRLNVKESVRLESLRVFVHHLLSQL